MEEEIWKDIVGYEGLYQVSNLGRVKSLSRKMSNGKGTYISKEKILKGNQDRYGYLFVNLCKQSKRKIFRIHTLVAITFLNFNTKDKLVVDHINNIRSDNRLENLQIITNRENCSKDKKKGTSKYIGVSWQTKEKRWRAAIRINSKTKYLGLFEDEMEASKAYQRELEKLNNKNK